MSAEHRQLAKHVPADAADGRLARQWEVVEARIGERRRRSAFARAFTEALEVIVRRWQEARARRRAAANDGALGHSIRATVASRPRRRSRLKRG